MLFVRNRNLHSAERLETGETGDATSVLFSSRRDDPKIAQPFKVGCRDFRSSLVPKGTAERVHFPGQFLPRLCFKNKRTSPTDPHLAFKKQLWVFWTEVSRPFGTDRVFGRSYPALERLGYCRTSLRENGFGFRSCVEIVAALDTRRMRRKRDPDSSLHCNSPNCLQAAMNSKSCEPREAFGLRRVPALWLDCLTDKKRRKAAQSKRFANFGCGFAALRYSRRCGSIPTALTPIH